MKPWGLTRGIGVALVVLSLVGAGGCKSTDAEAAESGPSLSAATPHSAAPKPLTATVVPADKAKDVVTASDITVHTNGQISALTVTKAGKPVAGAFTDDTGVWRPASQLEYSATYAVKVVAATDGGQPKTLTSTFTTMARPERLSGASMYFADGDTVGVAMPLVVEFTYPVPEKDRAAVERRLQVTANPNVVGSWYWFNGSEVHYRPEQYWTPGTKIALRVGVGGLPMGSGRYGKRDRFANITVGRALVSKIDNATHQMKVYKDGSLLRTMPVSLGKRSTPTSSGIHVVMEKQESVIMDSSTYGVPITAPGGYRTKVYSAVRYTWGGEFTHAAPWSVYDQGHRNVSHGCVNLSPSNARWYLDLAMRGDPIEIVGTEKKVKPQDGWTSWNIPWAAYLRGSALR